MWIVTEYSGNLTSGCFHAETYQGGMDTSFNTPNLTTDTDNEMFFGGCYAMWMGIDDISMNWDAAFDERHGNDESGDHIGVADRICVTSPKTDSASGDLVESGYYLALCATFRGA